MMMDHSIAKSITIAPYTQSLWKSLWQLRICQLAEHRIFLTPGEIPDHPLDVGREDPEWDYHHLADVYLKGAGGFWLAWWGEDPAGHIGGQDFSGAIELRRMYVRPEVRRHGVGACLVKTLLDHCQIYAIKVVELWTKAGGPGSKLYQRMGFKITDRPGIEFSDLFFRSNFTPGKDQIRMRFDL